MSGVRDPSTKFPDFGIVILFRFIACLFISTLLVSGYLAAGQNLLNDNSEAVLSSAISTPQFLPVEQAYQVDVQIDGHSLFFHWTLQPGYYLYKEKFRFAAKPADAQLGHANFPAGEFKWDDYFEKDVEVYYGTVSIELPFTGGLSKFLVRMESQGCADAGLCYPPRTQWVEVDSANQIALLLDSASVDKDFESTQVQEPTTASRFSLLPFFYALLGGLVLNLMPCVFPILSIKVLSFTRAHHSTHGKHLHGLVYTGGVVIAFVGFAAVMLMLRAAGEAVGWGFQLQSPGFVSFLVYLFFVMGLAFSGYLQFGTGLMSIGQKYTQGADSLGSSLLTGILATTVASPCTAPFMGTALGFAASQSAATALLVFAFLGLGMALPFILLSWIPGLTEKLPKPGPWMDVFKQFLAFPLFLTAAWLLWVLGHQSSIDVAAAVIGGLVLLAMAFWLWRQAGPAPLSAYKVLASAVFVLALLTPNWALSRLNTPNDWVGYSAAELQRLRQSGHVVFVNLTADWCITCLVNEKRVLTGDAFKQALKTNGAIYMKGDWTRRDAHISELLDQFGRTGVPLYLIYPPTGDPVVLPQLLRESQLYQALSDAGQIRGKKSD